MIDLKIREVLAEHAHDVWARWMKYLFSKMITMSGDILYVPKDLEERWKRQMNTAYKDLSEEEKESDRNIAEEIYQELLIFAAEKIVKEKEND